MNFKEVVQINEYNFYKPDTGEVYTSKSINLDAFVVASVSYVQGGRQTENRLEKIISLRTSSSYEIIVKFDQKLVNYFYSKALLVGERVSAVGGMREHLRFFILNSSIIIEIDNNRIVTQVGTLEFDNIVKQVPK